MHRATPSGSRATPPPLPAWDEAAALVAADGDGRLARELVAALIADLPADLAELRAAAARHDPAALAEAAHHLRGATRYCGVLALDAALDDLERAAAAVDAGRAADQLARVEIEIARLTEAFA